MPRVTKGRGGSPPARREDEATRAGDRPAAKPKSTIREYAEALAVALLLALFIRTFVVQAFKIPSGSMLETLQIGDHILVNKLRYGVRMPFSASACPVPPIPARRRGRVRVPEGSEQGLHQARGRRARRDGRGQAQAGLRERQDGRGSLRQFVEGSARQPAHAARQLRPRDGARRPGLRDGRQPRRSYDSRFWGSCRSTTCAARPSSSTGRGTARTAGCVGSASAT